MSGGVGSKNGPMCGSVGGGGGEAEGGDYVWHVGGSHLSALSPNQAHKTDSRGCLPLRTAASPLSCIPRKTATQRPLPRAASLTDSATIISPSLSPTPTPHLQSVTDRTNVPSFHIRRSATEGKDAHSALRRQNHLSEFPRVSRRSVGFRYNYPLFDTPARFDPHFLRIHRLNSNVRPLVCLSVRPSVRSSPGVGVAVAASEARSRLARRVSALLL